MMLKVRDWLETRAEQGKSILDAGGKPPARLKNRLQRTAVKLLAGFFAIMLVFTLVSRAADGITVARVKADTLKNGIITNRVLVNGIIMPLEDMSIRLPGDIYITDIKAVVGQKVSKDDVLLVFDGDDVDQQLDKLRDNLEINRLSIEAVESGASGGDSSAVMYARQALEQAQADYDRLLEKLNRGDARAENDLLEATRELENALNDDPEGDSSAINAARLSYEQALEDYEILKEKQRNNRQRAEDDLSEAENALADAGSAYRRAVEKAKADLINAAEDKVAAARASLAGTKESANDAIDNAQYAYDSALAKDAMNDKNYEAALNDVSKAETRLREAWDDLAALESAVEPDPAAIAAARTRVQSAQDALDAANNALAKLSYGESLETKRARETLNSTRDKWNGKISEAENALSDALAELTAAKAKTDMSDQQAVISAQIVVDSAQKSMKQAERALEDIIQLHADQLLAAERAIDTAQRNLLSAIDAVHKTADSAVEAAQKSVDNARRALEDNDQNTADQLLSAERAIETARRDLEQTIKQADDTAQNDEKSRRQAEIDKLTLLAEKQNLEQSIALLEEISALGGKLVSPIDGTIQSIANTGKTQDKVPVAIISHQDQGFYVDAKLDYKQAEKLAVGDSGTLSYTSEGKENEIDATITGIGAPDEDGKVPISASLPAGTYPTGASAELTITQTSDRQNACLHLSALRSSAGSDFVLVLREKKTVLGAEYSVVAVPVSVLMRDNENMSVSSSLTREDMVVVSANKPVAEGDMVRLETE